VKIRKFERRFIFASSSRRSAGSHSPKIIEVYFPEQAEIFRALIAENREINVIENLLLESAENKNTDNAELKSAKINQIWNY